jgi:hypothetical protein
MLHVFGIRHHGPGSARRLERALEQLQPDHILIEGPADVTQELQYVLHPDLVPPIALLSYNPKDFSQASYFPFAEYSPEWLAMRYALRNAIPMAFMDLPMSMQFSQATAARQELDFGDNRAEEPAIRDPLGYIAKIAGYSDSERWWEVTFEHEADDIVVFDQVLHLMTALREDESRQESLQTRQREAYMRKVIRKVVKEGAQRIAVVCGAWHAPVLAGWQSFPLKQDNQLLKGIKKTKVVSTWIPWSYELLATKSGYGAGVLSPAWYQLLFRQSDDVVVHWMARVSALLRKEDLDASAAHVLEAVRLAEALTALRQKKLPGIDELEEAARTVFMQGARAPLDLIREELIIGRVVGQVPASIPTVPLLKDVEQLIKKARLSKFYQSAGKETKELDLRKPSNLVASLLLHRLQLLGIPWGEPQAGPEGQLGSFREIWQLHWQPAFAIRLIEMGMWGNTLETACIRYVQDRAKGMQSLPELTQLTAEVLKADLSALIPSLVQRLQQASVQTSDVQFLMDAFPTLVQIIRYGNTRKTDVRAVEQLVDQLAPRISIGLPPICLNIEEEVARDIFKQLIQLNHALAILNDQEHQERWHTALLQIAEAQQAHDLLRGLASRWLFDKQVWKEEKAAAAMAYALSEKAQVLVVAHWLEGFLQGSGLLLLHHERLWKIVDDWVRQLPMTTFVDVVPLLRRAFSNFSEPEREQLLQFAKGIRKQQTERTIDPALAADISAILTPGLKRLLE